MANTTNWLNISSQSGSSGETILTLSAQRNLSTNYKTAEITAYNPVYNISAKTYVTIESYSPYIEVEPVIVGVPESGGTYQLSISSNCAYVIAYPDLVASYSTSAATGNTTITFSVTGTSADTTLVGNIVLTDESGQVSKTVRVEQYGQGAQISYWPGYLNFPASGGSGNIGVSANCVYTVTKSEGADWFSVSPSSGYTGRTDFTVTMTGENTGSSPLSGYVFINGPGNAGGVVEIRQNVPETRLVIYYDVTSTSNPTHLFCSSTSFSKAELGNGTELPLSATGYTFASTGRQAVYYTLTGTNIGSVTDCAFNGCYDIVAVQIPNGVTRIGYNAFGITSLSALTLPDSVTVIEDFAFTYTLISSLDLGTGLTSIGKYAFVGVSGLTSVEIPSSVTSIGNYAFTGSTASKFYFTSPTPATLGTSALNSTNLTEIIVPCVYYNAYVSAWPQYEQYMSCQDTQLYFITDTSNVKGIGETRTITILNTNINPNRTGLNLPSDFPAQGSYVVDGNTIYLTYPANPSSSSPRTWTIGVVAQTNDGESLSGSYRITQNAYAVVPIPYTADTSTVDASGETRTITIDTSGLVESSITISVEGATGVTTTYQNGVITVVFPENQGNEREITITIIGTTTGDSTGRATVVYVQEDGILYKEYLTFVVQSPGKIRWSLGLDTSGYSYTGNSKVIEYRKNNGNWISIRSNRNDSAPSIDVVAGDIVEFRGNNSVYCSSSSSPLVPDSNGFYGTSCLFAVKGNIMSLVYGDSFSGNTELVSGRTFPHLFRLCTGLTDASDLYLPADTLTDYCYYRMFGDCSSLVAAPELPATTLTLRSYEFLFQGCTSLTTGPSILPATTLYNYCYDGMFQYCTSLTTAPELPATTLPLGCYDRMFQGCSSLTTAPELPATTVEFGCCQQMFQDCTSLSTGPSILPATTLAQACYSNMFGGCTSLTTAPELPATTLASSCYESMFGGCTSLTTAPELPATTLGRYCYHSMFSGCTSLTTAPELPATTLAQACYSHMFQYCTSLTTAPELPAETLTTDCYDSMFSGCSSLNYIKALFTTTPETYYTGNWVSGVAATGTFVKNSSATWSKTGVDGIPNNWTVISQ